MLGSEKVLRNPVEAIRNLFFLISDYAIIVFVLSVVKRVAPSEVASEHDWNDLVEPQTGSRKAIVAKYSRIFGNLIGDWRHRSVVCGEDRVWNKATIRDCLDLFLVLSYVCEPCTRTHDML